MIERYKKSSAIRWIAFVICFIPYLLSAQHVYNFTKGLVLNPVHQYGRQALYIDPLAFALYQKTLKTPISGSAFSSVKDHNELIWKEVHADTANRFGGDDEYRASGYIYFSYNAAQARTALLNIRGNSAVFVNGVLHFGDPYDSGWMYIPVQLNKGKNEFYVRGQYVKASLLFPANDVTLNTDDPTFPDIVTGRPNANLKAAVVVINSSLKELKGLRIKSSLNGKVIISQFPAIPSMSTRKVIFRIDAQNSTSIGQVNCKIELQERATTLAEQQVKLNVVATSDKYKNTFISGIDGSLQYYAVAPQLGSFTPGSALFFSVHGAGVEAIGQAKAYKSKDWGNLVAPTNRRPRGFNWEDWGRLDALEVLKIATDKFKPDPQRIYLTGHSMGGHGTWFLGATYPEKWAAIAPCSGYPTLKGYGSADGLIPDSSTSSIGEVLLRASNQSDVIKLATNYKPLGVYVLHGDADPVVSVKYARQMKNILAGFHPDYSYYEYPGGSHWYGDQSVDWNPLFDFFRWHKRSVDSAINVIDFKTSSPGISASYRWASVIQQDTALEYSRIKLLRDKLAGVISGSTENVRLLKLSMQDFGASMTVSIQLDSLQTVSYTTRSESDSLYLLKAENKWTITGKPPLSQKGPHRYGTFKEPFSKNMIFVYSTKGTKEENEWSINKARYDAEAWYYRGNGAVDIIADKQYSKSKYAGRNVIVYGNASSNGVWKQLLQDCPVQVNRNSVRVGANEWKGDDLGAYFIWPLKGSAVNSVAVISGTGLRGMNAANANQYFAGGSGFPDFMVFSLDMLNTGVEAVKTAGFYTNNWEIGTK
ncbi:carboxylesterase family protein [Arcticibacter eurypsychrophilus]|uniref:carboxylesterase family protein n=1 Tax=Arcticibacter eurypsychrophilus TaxID=1434752 RepID=UPI0009F23171|nr:PHB depolymerase family esterase [Arcticibacter eurypsychrophilus]